MLPGKANDILELLAGENKPLTTAVPGNFYAGYTPVVTGAFTFTVSRPSDSAHPLKRLPISLPPDAYVTILATAKDGQPAVEAINDTLDPKTAGIGRLIVRQYVVGARVTAAVGTTSTLSALGYGDTAILDNLPSAQTTVDVQVTLPNLPTKPFSIPVDFSATPHATLLIAPDPNGRVRPRLTEDGHAVIEPPPTAPH